MKYVIQVEQPDAPMRWVRWAFSHIGFYPLLLELGMVFTTMDRAKAKVYEGREAANKAVAAITTTEDGRRYRIVETS